RSAASTSASVSAPRRVRRSRTPLSRSESESNKSLSSSTAARWAAYANTNDARERIALSGGSLRPRGPGGEAEFAGSLRERAKPRGGAGECQDEPRRQGCGGLRFRIS